MGAFIQCLPGEVHHYDIAISATPPPHARGVLLPHSKVPFLHPAQVTTIVSVSEELSAVTLFKQLYCSYCDSSFYTMFYCLAVSLAYLENSVSTMVYSLLRSNHYTTGSSMKDNNEIHWSINSCPPESVSASTDLMSSNGSLSLTGEQLVTNIS